MIAFLPAFTSASQGLFTACGYSIISFVYNFLSVILVRIPLAYLA